jgi:hypothetical protein
LEEWRLRIEDLRFEIEELGDMGLWNQRIKELEN